MSAAPVPSRDPYLENARFLLIALVVAGHFLEPFIQRSEASRVAYVAIYLFHMPLFAALSGRLSSASRLELPKLISRLLFPYLVFQALFVAGDHLLGRGTSPLGLTRPYWVLWFLVSLFTWRVLLPFLPRSKWLVPASFALAVLAGLVDGIGYELSLSRTLVFLPFFLVGHATREVDLSRLMRPRWTSGVLLIALGVIAWTVAPSLDVRWLYGSCAYAALGADGLTGALVRTGLLFAAALGAVAFLAFVPRVPVRWLGDRGSRTMAVFLLHALIVRGLDAAGAFKLVSLPLFWAIFGIALTFALSAGFVTFALEPILAPRWLEQRLRRAADARREGPLAER